LFAKETLLVGAALIGLTVLPKTFRSDGRYLPVLITGIGALISVLQMLVLPMVTYRYEMDLQPALSLFAVLGYVSLSRLLAAHHTKVPAFICAVLLSFNIAFSHLDLLRGKLRNGALDESESAQLYKLTYPVSALLWIGPPPT
jgi:hypothetical protein